MTRPRIWLAGVLLMVGLSWSGCQETSPRLDTRLSSGETRAGRISEASELIGGPTARGRTGDFKLYNDRIAVIVGQAGLARGFQPYGGSVLDADRIRSPEDEGASAFGEIIHAVDLSVLKPERVEVVAAGGRGQAAHVRVTGKPAPMPLFDALLSQLFQATPADLQWSVDYILEPSADWLRIEHTLSNPNAGSLRLGLFGAGFIFGDGADPVFPGYGFRLPEGGETSELYGAAGGAVSYLFGQPDQQVQIIVAQSGIVFAGLGDGPTLRGGERVRITQFLVVGDGDLAQTHAFWRRVTGAGEGVKVTGRVTRADGVASAGAYVHATLDAPEVDGRDYVTRTRAGEDGAFELSLSPGRYRLRASAEGHVVGPERAVTITAQRAVESMELQVPQGGTVRYAVVDEQGRDLPVKLSVLPLEPRERLPERFGAGKQGWNLLHTEFAHQGRGALPLPEGRYRVFVSRGLEYEVAQEDLTLTPGSELPLEVVLPRSVATEGWMTTDTHVHAQLSPDSPDLYPFKVRAMVVENVELPISTEHEAIGDFNPAIEALGLQDWIRGIVGTEVTTYVYGHFNAFPLVADPDKPGNGRIDWYYKRPAETFAAIRANPGDPFIQVNHPRAPSIGGYFSAMGFDPETFSARRSEDFSLDFDGIEVMNGCGGYGRDTMVDWFGFLNHGHRKVATGSTDNHRAAPGDMGLPVSYVRMPTDDPRAAKVDDLRAAFKEGRVSVSCGPFVELKVGEAEVGDVARLDDDRLTVSARVAAASWVDVDELLVIVNGEIRHRASIESDIGVERFSGDITLEVTPGRDAWVIIWALGNSRHGVWARERTSFGFTNPVFLDGDGDGAWKMP